MVKKQIREIYHDKRLQLGESRRAAESGRMVDNFRTIELQGIQNLLSYYAIPERSEFDVASCEVLLGLESPSLQIFWPRINGDGHMDALLIHKDSQMQKNRFGILEPAEGEITDPQLIDAVFVPLLAFDARGYRVGYGKGYYDRYLSRCAQDTVKIGFSFFEAVDGIDDINEFDVPLNYCITPLRVYEF